MKPSDIFPPLPSPHKCEDDDKLQVKETYSSSAWLRHWQKQHHLLALDICGRPNYYASQGSGSCAFLKMYSNTFPLPCKKLLMASFWQSRIS